MGDSGEFEDKQTRITRPFGLGDILLPDHRAPERKHGAHDGDTDGSRRAETIFRPVGRGKTRADPQIKERRVCWTGRPGPDGPGISVRLAQGGEGEIEEARLLPCLRPACTVTCPFQMACSTAVIVHGGIMGGDGPDGGDRAVPCL